MSNFEALLQKIRQWSSARNQRLHLLGLTPDQWTFLSSSFFKNELYSKRHLLLCSTADEAEATFESMRALKNIYLYPGLGHSPYSSVISSERSLFDRLSVLGKLLTTQEPMLVVASLEAAQLLAPPVEFFKEHRFEIKKDDIISPFDLTKKLMSLGYQSVSSVEEPGTFCRKGEIFDLYPVGGEATRLQYFDDLVEIMWRIDLSTQKTLRNQEVNTLSILPGPELWTHENYAATLRTYLPQPQPQYKNRYESRKNLFSSLQQGRLFENYAVYAPLFFEKPLSLLNIWNQNDFVTVINPESGQKEFEFLSDSMDVEYLAEQERIDSDILLPAPDKLFDLSLDFLKRPYLFVETLDVQVSLDEKLDERVHLNFESIRSYLQRKIQAREGSVPDQKPEFIKAIFKQLLHELKNEGQLIVCSRHDQSLEEIRFLLEENGFASIKNRLSFLKFAPNEGFVYTNEKIFVLCEADLFGAKKKKARATKPTNPDLFAEQLATLKIEDYVVHRDYGIGIYKGLETIRVGEQESDFVVIVYEGQDKVYVPVYKLNLVQKHADSTAQVKVASLKSKKFSELKARARLSVKKLAFDLLRLQAERKLQGGFAFSEPDHLFKEFELSFSFEETPDQMKAIEDVIDDMQQNTSMDRLVCGDVGFGKTEVAMRAAFKAVLDKKQVVVLVPTTVLALQHFHSFKRRFKEFPVNIDFLSRFKSTKEAKETMVEVAEGKVDILIGTHKVLSESLEFKDLGLVIVDEEHRFGVAHKEKMKLLKASVDFLTLTATPIPRTLQLSFLGLRDLSLIQTAPPRRQSIKTYLIKEDDTTIKAAIEKELGRGGQIFFVHNRVHDIEEYEIYLKKLVPGLRVSVTHGQMNEKELEKRINDFYEHKSDVLLTTTIIESGIDIPNANTMIIDRADTYGLAQLHQLRGRIGRSDRKAYAYFVVPAHRILSETANKRLQALQTYADMGSGFALASCDLEIRGAGDILGGEQSGHIEAIGLELYMDLLQEAIQEIRGERKVVAKNIEIQAPFNSYIPNNYIADHAQRLKYYKRLSNCTEITRLDEVIDELTDVFGLPPKELESLYAILRSRIMLQRMAVKQVRVSNATIHLYFDQELLQDKADIRDKILQQFLGKPKLYKINPDSSVICYFKDTITQQTLFEFSKHIAQQTGVC